jgi:hypothetical protein
MKFASIVIGTFFNFILFIWLLYRYEFILHEHPTGIMMAYCIATLVVFFTILLMLYVVAQDKCKQTFEKYDKFLEDKKKL